MRMRTLDAIVAESPVFAGLDQRYLELVAACASNIVFGAGDYLCREGKPAQTFYLVRHGRVMLETFVPGRGAVTIETIDDGEVIGWSWLFPPYRWHFDARALDRVRAVEFEAACLGDKIETDRVFGYELLRRFSPLMLERLQATRLQLLDVYGNGTP